MLLWMMYLFTYVVLVVEKDAVFLKEGNSHASSVTTRTVCRLQAFNNDTEKLFGKTVVEIKAMKDLGDAVAFQAIEEKLRKKTTFFKLGPSNSLGSSNVLEWSLKTIETAEDASKKDFTKSTVARSDEIEFSDLNMNVDFTSTKSRGSASVNVEQIVTATNEDTPDSKAKDKRKGKLSETTALKFPLSPKGIVIANEGHGKITQSPAHANSKNLDTTFDSKLILKPLEHSAAETPVTVKSHKISPDEWTKLCRTRMSGTKQSPVTPAQTEEKKTNSLRVKTVARKKLRFTTSPSDENADTDYTNKEPANLATSTPRKSATSNSDANTDAAKKDDHVTEPSTDSLVEET